MPLPRSTSSNMTIETFLQELRGEDEECWSSSSTLSVSKRMVYSLMDLEGLWVSLKERALRLRPFFRLLISFIEMVSVSYLKRTQGFPLSQSTSLTTYPLSPSQLIDVRLFLSPLLVGKSLAVLRGVGGCGCDSILQNWASISPRMAGVVVIWPMKAKTVPQMLSSASAGTSSSPMEHASATAGRSVQYGGKAGKETECEECWHEAAPMG